MVPTPDESNSPYVIQRASADVPLRGDRAGTPWEAVDTVDIGTYPWDVETSTTFADGREASSAGDDINPQDLSASAAILYDEQSVYLHYHVRDTHPQARTTELNGPVSADSCVEWFASPEPTRGKAYINFEANCAGVIHVGVGPDREHRRVISHDMAEDIYVETSIGEAEWWLAAAIPFSTLTAFTGLDIRPSTGSVWRGNLYCCRGAPAPRFVVWNTIHSPTPDFHRPGDFGRFVFG